MKYVFAALLSFSSMWVSAGIIEVETSEVSRVFAGYEGGEVFFRAKGNFTNNPAECTAGNLSGERTFVVNPAESNVDHVLSILLTAHVAKKNLSIQYHDDKCFSNHVVIRRVAIY